MLHAASAVARRRVASMATQQMQRRSMGSGPKPEWTGIDKTVRNIFPEDWQRELIPDSLQPYPVFLVGMWPMTMIKPAIACDSRTFYIYSCFTSLLIIQWLLRFWEDTVV